MELEIRQGGEPEEFIRLLMDVRNAMGESDWFYLDPPEEIRAMEPELWTAMDENRMAGALSILRPGPAEYNYGFDLDFSEAELHRVIQLDTVAVRPEYRGRGLQRILVAAAEKAQPKGSIFLCTVHPDNRYSLSNFLASGYHIAKTLPKYGSVRCILRKDLD